MQLHTIPSQYINGEQTTHWYISAKLIFAIAPKNTFPGPQPADATQKGNP